MSLKVINFDLNFIPTGVPPIVHIHQYDLGEIVTLRPTLYYRDELYNGMNLEECDFIVAYQRPDGSQQSYTIENHVFYDEYVFEFPLDANMTAMHGPNVMSLGFVDRTTNNILWTQNFILFIERHPIQAEDYIGSSVYDGMIRTLQQYIDEAYSSTPEGYEEHIAKMREVEETIDNLRQEINENLEEANEYTNNKIAGLDSVYATLQDVIDAQNEGRAYAGQLVGDTETNIKSDMSLLYQTKDDATTDKTDLQIYAEQVSTESATEVKEYLGLDYTSSEPGLTETGLLNTVITQTAEGIVQEATAEFITESEAEGVISSQVNSKVEQKANEITSSISQIYETKADANQKLSDAQSYANSQISQKAGEITSTVKAYTDDTISNLKIGAQNLLRGTNEYKTTDTEAGWTPSYNNGGWQATGTVTAYSLDDNPGNGFTIGAKIQNGKLSQNSIDFLVNKKAYVIHMYLKGSGLPDPHGDKAVVDAALKNIVYFRNTATGNKLVLDYATETDQETGEETVIRNQSFNYHYPYKEVVTYPTYTELDEVGNEVTKVRKQVDYVEITDSAWRELEWYIICDSWPENVDLVVDSSNGTLDVCGIKMEEGSKATAWQPNEFDIKKYTNTQIQQTNDRISLIAEAQDTTDGNVSALSSRLDVEAGKISQLVQGGYLTPNGQNGWSVTSVDTLVNRAVTNVSTSYHIDENTIQGINNRIDATDEGVTIASRQMRSLGVENLIRATDLCETLSSSADWNLADKDHGWRPASTNSTTKSRITLSQTDRPFNNVTRAWRFVYPANSSVATSNVAQDSVPMVYGKTYTMSCYARCTAGSGKIHLQTWKASGSEHTKMSAISSEDGTGWKLYSFTFTHDFANYKDNTNIYFGVSNWANTTCTVEICAMKLELGEVPTVWCPSVFDVEAQTQAFIKVESNRITQQVSDLSGNISRIEETSNNIQLSVANMKVGGTNLVPNSTFESNSTNHTVSGTWSFGTIAGKKCMYCDGAMGNTKYVAFTPSYVPKKGDVYTFSADVYLSNGVKGTTNPYVALYRSGGTINGVWRQATVLSGTEDLFEHNNSGWVRAHLSFKYEDDYLASTTLACSIYARDFTGRFAFRNVKFEKGSLPTEWSPAPEDAQNLDGNDIVSMINLTDNSVTIQGSKINVNGWTEFTNVSTQAGKVGGAIKQGTVQRLYYQKRSTDSTKHTAPTKPSSKVTTSSNNYDVWSTTLPSYASGATWWTCEQYQDINGTWYFTDVSAYNYTQIDGGNIRTGTVIVGDQLKLGGEMSVFTANKDSTTTGGYIGYESGNNGVRDTNGMILRSTGSKSYDSFAGKQTWPSYIHVSDSGIVIRSAYLQLRQSGSQAVKIINDNGLNLKEYANTGGVKITAQSRDDDAVAANLTVYAKTLSFDCSNNNVYFNPHASGDTIYFQRGTSANEAQIGSYSSNFTTGKTWWTHGWFQNVGTQSGGVVSLSDRRSKTDIKYNIIDGDLIDTLKPARFKMIGDTDDRYHFGLIAQDVLDVYPDLVGSWGDGEDQRYNLSYEAFIPFLISKCQKLQKQIDELKGEVI